MTPVHNPEHSPQGTLTRQMIHDETDTMMCVVYIKASLQRTLKTSLLSHIIDKRAAFMMASGFQGGSPW